MPGHVFVTRGDLTRLTCDAWLLPTDAALHVTSAWRERASPALREWLQHLGEVPLPTRWGDSGTRVLSFADWPAMAHQPRPYLVNVGGYIDTPTEWYMDGVRQFCAFVARQEPIGSAVSGRSRPLVGLPLVGTGRGGASAITGKIVRELLDTLDEEATRYNLDIVLVTASAPALTVAQSVRLKAHAGQPEHSPWPELPGEMAQLAQRLAHHAARDKLVLFLGAGIGRGAGLPTWDDLLDELAEDAGMDERERAALYRLPVLDRARIVENRLAAIGRSLGQCVQQRIKAERYSLAHSLLATLPVAEAVTTNYDRLFEFASEDAGWPAAILPYQAVTGHERWLLKMHGCVTHPQDIVLTREDYLRYADRRAALAGIVQALLITRHMLFVGFSLTDDNFQRIVDDVRKAIYEPAHDGRHEPAAPFGTALLMRRDALLMELWRRDLEFVSLSGNSDVSPDATRQLEIFLDYLLAEATHGTVPLLDDAYEGILTEDELDVKRLLQEMQSKAPDRIRNSSAWRPVATFLASLGGPPVLNDL